MRFMASLFPFLALTSIAVDAAPVTWYLAPTTTLSSSSLSSVATSSSSSIGHSPRVPFNQRPATTAPSTTERPSRTSFRDRLSLESVASASSASSVSSASAASASLAAASSAAAKASGSLPTQLLINGLRPQTATVRTLEGANSTLEALTVPCEDPTGAMLRRKRRARDFGCRRSCGLSHPFHPDLLAFCALQYSQYGGLSRFCGRPTKVAPSGYLGAEHHSLRGIVVTRGIKTTAPTGAPGAPYAVTQEQFDRARGSVKNAWLFAVVGWN
ncbi:hypothetical protein JCM10213v2_008359 [Rhodosporidiobolus nylandii]